MERGGLYRLNILVVSILVETAAAGEDDESNFSITEHRQLISFLQQPVSSLAEGHLPIGCVLNPLYLNFSSPHPFFF